MSSPFERIFCKNLCGMERRVGEIIMERIGEALATAGFKSFRQLAREAGIRDSTLLGWRDLKKAPDGESWLRLIRTLQVTEDYLLGRQSLADARAEYQRWISAQSVPEMKRVPLANSVREVVELSILIREGRIGEWEGDMVEIAVDAPGDFCVVCPDDSMGDRPKRGDVVSCTLDVRLADGAVVVLSVPDCDYPILRVVQKTENGIRFVPRRMVQGKYVDRVYQENEVKVLARALEIVRGKL